MGAALAIAVLLVVVVGVLSLAMNSQNGPITMGQRPPGAPPGGGPRISHPGSGASRTARRPTRDRPERAERPDKPERERAERPSRPERAERGERPSSPPTVVPSGGSSSSAPADDPALIADVKPLNSQAVAQVVSVVDERTLGPVTRSRLTLRVEPPGQEAFEVTTRVAFQTPEERARVKVGGTLAVRYDSEDHRRVVVDKEAEPPG